MMHRPLVHTEICDFDWLRHPRLMTEIHDVETCDEEHRRQRRRSDGRHSHTIREATSERGWNL